MNKPYIKKYHVILEMVSLVILLSAIIIAIVKASTVSGPIPIHYNMSGEVDKYGSVGSLVILPIIMLFTCGVMSLIVHFMPPSAYNMPFKVKPGREIPVYADVILMINIMQILFGLFAVTFTCFYDNDTALTVASIALVSLIVVNIMVTLIKAYRDNN